MSWCRPLSELVKSIVRWISLLGRFGSGTMLSSKKLLITTDYCEKVLREKNVGAGHSFDPLHFYYVVF